MIATDADVDGMHIRLLLISFFLQYFPELIARGHLFILVQNGPENLNAGPLSQTSSPKRRNNEQLQ